MAQQSQAASPALAAEGALSPCFPASYANRSSQLTLTIDEHTFNTTAVDAEKALHTSPTVQEAQALQTAAVQEAVAAAEAAAARQADERIAAAEAEAARRVKEALASAEAETQRRVQAAVAAAQAEEAKAEEGMVAVEREMPEAPLAERGIPHSSQSAD